MPPLPFLPDDVLSEIIFFLTPPPPLSMAPSPSTLLSEILEVFRPPDRFKKDLASFSKSSKRFKMSFDLDQEGKGELARNSPPSFPSLVRHFSSLQGG